MAKKAKVAKKAKATKKAKKAAGTKIPLHKVVHFVRMLNSRKRSAKFVAHAKKQEASINITPANMMVIRDFLEKHNLQGDVCPTDDPFKCP